MKFWLRELKQEKLKFKTFPTSESNPAIGLILKLNILGLNLAIHQCGEDDGVVFLNSIYIYLIYLKAIQSLIWLILDWDKKA